MKHCPGESESRGREAGAVDQAAMFVSTIPNEGHHQWEQAEGNHAQRYPYADPVMVSGQRKDAEDRDGYANRYGE
jgi:hypothetical protein